MVWRVLEKRKSLTSAQIHTLNYPTGSFNCTNYVILPSLSEDSNICKPTLKVTKIQNVRLLETNDI
jgi:hypothetical protein